MRTFYFLLAAVFSVNAGAASLSEPPQITVSGEAVVYAAPDKAAVTFGVKTWDKSLDAAKKRNDERLRKAVTAIRMTGVPESGIETEYLSIEPQWKERSSSKIGAEDAGDEILGYYVSNSFTVTVNDPRKVETVITQALQAGVNSVGQVNFQVAEPRPFREQARELALKAAAEKAEKMAAVLKQRIGEPIQIEEITSNYGWSGYAGGRGSMSQNVAYGVQGSDGGDTIAAGKIAVRGNVKVVFRLQK